jgi:hypothetical protein
MRGGSKNVLVRGIGPALADYGVSGVLADPVLYLHGTVGGNDTVLATNDNWGDGGLAPTLSAVFDTLSAFPLPNTASKDAALLTAVEGARTVHVSSVTPGAQGVALVELYDGDSAAAPQLVNISARNYAGRDSETLIAGFFIEGTAPKRVLIRGVGPTLADYGVTAPLADPRLDLHATISGADRVIASNDDWADEPGVATASSDAYAFPLRAASLDAAIVTTLPAGGYTVHVTGVNSTTGEALIEVYELP